VSEVDYWQARRADICTDVQSVARPGERLSSEIAAKLGIATCPHYGMRNLENFIGYEYCNDCAKRLQKKTQPAFTAFDHEPTTRAAHTN